jgi:hypothetical protein
VASSCPQASTSSSRRSGRHRKKMKGGDKENEY